MNSRAAASSSLTWRRTFLQSSIADHLLVRTQAVEPRRENMHDGQQILHQFLLWRKRLAIDDHEVCSMPLTEGGKPLKPEPHEPVLMRDNEPLYPPELNRFHEAVEVLALIVQAAPYLFYPLINPYLMSLAVRPESRDLILEVRLLGLRGDPRIGNRCACSFRFQAAILQVLVMRVVPPVGRGPMGRQNTRLVPALQGQHGFANECPKLFWAICILQVLVMRVVPPVGRGPMGRQNTRLVPALQGQHGFANECPKLFWAICILHDDSIS